MVGVVVFVAALALFCVSLIGLIISPSIHASPCNFILFKVTSPIPLTFIKSLIELNGLVSIIACALTGPIPDKASNSSNQAVLILIWLSLHAAEIFGNKKIKKIPTNKIILFNSIFLLKINVFDFPLFFPFFAINILGKILFSNNQ